MTRRPTILSNGHFALYSVFSPLSVSSHWPHLCYSQFRLDTSSTWAGNYWLVPDSGLLTRLCKTENTVWKWFYIDLGKLNSKSNQASTLFSWAQALDTCVLCLLVSAGVNINDNFCSQLVSCIVQPYQVLVAATPVTKTMPDIKREETKGWEIQWQKCRLKNWKCLMSQF